QHRDGVLELRALHAQVEALRARRVELRLGLHDVQARDDAGIVAVARHLQGLAIGVGGLVEQRFLRVERAQLEVVLRQRRLREQPRVDEVARARLRPGVARLDQAPDAAPQVGLPGEVERQRIDGALVCRLADDRPGGLRGLGLGLLDGAGELRPEARARLLGERRRDAYLR